MTTNLQWPLKLMRVPANAPFFHGANLLIAADCSAFAYPRFDEVYHSEGHVLVIGCPDAYGESFMEKIEQIVKINDVQSVTLVKMSEDCCHRMSEYVMSAIRASGKDIPLHHSSIIAYGERVD